MIKVNKYHQTVFDMFLTVNCCLVLGFAGLFHDILQPAAVKGKYNISKAMGGV